MISPRCANERMRTNLGTMIECMFTIFVLKESFWPHPDGNDGKKRIVGKRIRSCVFC